MKKLKTPEEFIIDYMVSTHKDDVLFERCVVHKLMEKYAEEVLNFKSEFIRG